MVFPVHRGMQGSTLLADAAKPSSAAVAAANTAGGIGKSSPSPADAVASGAELLSSLQDMRDINNVVLMGMVLMFACYQPLVYRTQAAIIAGGMSTDLLDADWTLRSPSEVPPTMMMLAGGAACRLLAAPGVGVCMFRPPTHIKLHVTQQGPSVQASSPLSKVWALRIELILLVVMGLSDQAIVRIHRWGSQGWKRWPGQTCQLWWQPFRPLWGQECAAEGAVALLGAADCQVSVCDEQGHQSPLLVSYPLDGAPDECLLAPCHGISLILASSNC